MTSAREPAPRQDPSALTRTEEEFETLAVDLLLSMLASASTDDIDPKKWWETARSALEVGAQAADFSAMVARMGKRLKIEALRAETSSFVSSVASDLSAVEFRRFRSKCKQDALYIVALARMKRDEEKEAAKAAGGKR
jgi:hypothetical protein